MRFATTVKWQARWQPTYANRTLHKRMVNIEMTKHRSVVRTLLRGVPASPLGRPKSYNVCTIEPAKGPIRKSFSFDAADWFDSDHRHEPGRDLARGR